MAEMAQVIDYAPTSPGSVNERRLFLGCWLSLIATAFGFMVRAMLLADFGTLFNLSEKQKGAISGAGLFPFAISIILFSLFIDRIGYGVTMVFAFAGHVGGTLLMIFAKNYEMLYLGTLILALANGAVEAVVNPVTATLFPTKKTHYLNILHSGWPAGLVLAGVIAIAMGNADWHWKVGLVLIPTVLYGVLLMGQKFPVQERVTAGVPYADMMREFGAAGCLILTYFLMQAVGTVLSVFGVDVIGQVVSAAVAVVLSVAYFGVYRSIGRPMFVFLLLVMILLATTELGVDSWVTDLMTPAFGAHAAWILVYTSFIMFLLRFCAGPLVHRLSPLGLLCVCAALACCGLLALSGASTTKWLLLAATLYGVGKSFFWPTTLGVVAEQFPRGGALTLNAMGGMGMIAVGVLGGPFLGALQDKNLDTQVSKDHPAIYAIVADKQVTNLGMTYSPLDKSKIALLPPDQKQEVEKEVGITKQGVLKIFALLPATMFLCYVGLIIYFRGKGGYKLQKISGEEASGGIQAAIEA
jgi:MFS family permease